MSRRNKFENKALRRRERREHVPNICLASPGNAAKKVSRKLQARPLAKVFQIFKRSVRRMKRTQQLIAKLPPNQTSLILERIKAHCKWLGSLTLQELDRREKQNNTVRATPSDGSMVPKSEIV